MRVRIGAALTTAIAIGFGLLTLVGLLVGGDSGLLATSPLPLLQFLGDELTLLTRVFLQLVVITVGFTVIIGIVNLVVVHLGRIFGRKKGAVYSLVLILSFFLVVVTYIVQKETSLILLENVQVSVESALAGLLLFALVYGAYRMLRRRVTLWNVLFIVVLLIVLVGALPLGNVAVVTNLSNWLFRIPVSAGARGILLGISLATIVTGVRVLIGQDRSYRE